MDEWERREAAMRDIIYTTVSPSTMTEIKGGKTAKDVWDALVNKFENVDNVAIRTQIYRQLNNMKCVEGENLRVHLAQMDDLFDRLEQLGMEMDHTQRVEHIKESIPDSYQVIVTQMQQTVFAMNLAKKKKKTVLSSKDVIAQLQARFDADEQQKKSNESVAMAASRMSKGKGAELRPRGLAASGRRVAEWSRLARNVQEPG